MAKVSVIIPGRTEPYFQATVASVLEAATGDIEVIAVVDGDEAKPYLQFDDPRVKIIRLEKSIGQRAGYNLGVRESSGKYVMKLDAHAKVSHGFDETLQSHCPDDAVVLPEMRRLNVHTWEDKPRGKTHFMYCGIDLYCHYWQPYRKREEAKAEYPEVMTGQGSCWFCTREWNDHMGLLDEGVGSWGNVGIEISLRTWLCGGRQIVNKNVWQAHWFRKDEGGFTYPMNGRQVAKAHAYTRKNYYFNDHAFKNQTRPFKWIIDKFAPVPGWEVYSKDGFNMKRTIVYYTDHHIDETLAARCRKLLSVAATNIPIISVSQKPLNFGKNICVGVKPRSNHSIYEQIMAGLEQVEPGSVVYLAEHDVVYQPSHFVHIPEVKDRLDYNQNRYYWAPGQIEYMKAKGKWALSQLVAYREFLVEKVKESLAVEKPTSEMYRCRTHKFESERPNIDIRHGKNFSQDGKWKKAYYNGTAKDTTPNVGYWGSPPHFLKKLGWNPGTEMVSMLCRLLRKHYGLTQFMPAPLRIKGFHRVDVAKTISLMGLKKGAEIGVAGGEHSEILWNNIKDCELTAVDHWDTIWSRKLKTMAYKRLTTCNAHIINKSSLDASLEVPNGSLDWVYIDASHDFDNVMLDLLLWIPKVRKGGLVAGHDYDRGHKELITAVNTYTTIHHIQEWFLTDQKREASFFWEVK